MNRKLSYIKMRGEGGGGGYYVVLENASTSENQVKTTEIVWFF